MARDSVSWPDLVKIMGVDGAMDFCNAYAGLPVYIRKSPSDELLFILGEVAALSLCKHYGGSEIIPVLGPSRASSVKDVAIPMLESGMSELEVAKALRKLGMRCHIRTVQGAAQVMNHGKKKESCVSTKNRGVHRLPGCLMEANGVGGER